jgi:hypothetical protein
VTPFGAPYLDRWVLRRRFLATLINMATTALCRPLPSFADVLIEGVDREGVELLALPILVQTSSK